MKVENFKGVKNQFLITEEGRGALGNFIKRETFQSYNSVIVVKTFWQGGIDIVLDADKWDYSKTTGKYRNLFLGEDKKTTEKKIKGGIYKLENLNS